MTTSAELLLHPVRLRVVQALLGGRELTTTDLRAVLTDVPPATLYRQVNTLVVAGVLEVTAERRVRGAVERTFRLRAERASVPEEELAAMSVAEHRVAFTTFVAGLLADFDRYLAEGDPDLARDLAGYRMAGLYATDAELRQVITTIQEAVRPYAQAGPGPGRTRRLLATILLPEPTSGPRIAGETDERPA
ncbi:helix-turn-helix domain-containing protein [Micromonospora endolithica]|uniref:ArsR family transcriptional regulator n=1 Tax=Micromonospora endolithica TaxID=230091 RepID=A0A3A9Z639_9ACTN|nr:helix-turn-helix domain-containing protein [Micromonospora endolithica]RKN43489.1 ArsR family transcriptional regulator [Micromonospora endolithica]TWJ24073.1 helix-turn-helix protein [Micromonospora endolithica]